MSLRVIEKDENKVAGGLTNGLMIGVTMSLLELLIAARMPT